MDVGPLTEHLRFDGRTVAVTGGAQGIGRATCESFATLGANVVVVDVEADQAKMTAREIETEYNADALAIETDVRSYKQTQRMADQIDAEFGRLDVIVNNAGVWRESSFSESDPALGSC